jgi:hypothetical protein
VFVGGILDGQQYSVDLKRVPLPKDNCDTFRILYVFVGSTW